MLCCNSQHGLLPLYFCVVSLIQPEFIVYVNDAHFVQVHCYDFYVTCASMATSFNVLQFFHGFVLEVWNLGQLILGALNRFLDIIHDP